MSISTRSLFRSFAAACSTKNGLWEEEKSGKRKKCCQGEDGEKEEEDEDDEEGEGEGREGRGEGEEVRARVDGGETEETVAPGDKEGGGTGERVIEEE